MTPTLPGRLAWLADDIDGFPALADERLDTVLGHMQSIDAHVSGWAGRGSVLTPIADAVARFRPTTSCSHCAAQSTPTGKRSG